MEGDYYVIESDSVGNLAVGPGLDLFKGGFAADLIEAGYPTTYGSLIPKDFVDELYKKVILQKIEAVEAACAELELTNYQKLALASRCYNCGDPGGLNGFVEAYKQYWGNEAPDAHYLEPLDESMLQHPLFVNFMSGPATASGTFLPGLLYRRESEWYLFYTGQYYKKEADETWGNFEDPQVCEKSGDLLASVEKTSSKIVDMAKEVAEEMLEKGVCYVGPGDNRLIRNDIDAFSNFETSKYSSSASYVAAVLYRSGYIKPEEMNKYNYHLVKGSEGLEKILSNNGWKRVGHDDIREGDIIIDRYYSEALIYAGDDKVWSARSCTLKSSSNIPTAEAYKAWSQRYYQDKANVTVWREIDEEEEKTEK